MSPHQTLPPGGLTSQEKFLLEWLGKEDNSAYGECYGSALNVLINCGLAQTSETPPSDYSRVSLTDAGFVMLKMAKQTAG